MASTEEYFSQNLFPLSTILSYLPAQALRTFIQDQWMNAYALGHLTKEPSMDIDFQRMMRQFEVRGTVALLDLP